MYHITILYYLPARGVVSGARRGGPRSRSRSLPSYSLHIYIYIYIYICVVHRSQIRLFLEIISKYKINTKTIDSENRFHASNVLKYNFNTLEPTF